MTATLGFVGLGVMGQPECLNLQRGTGLPMYVFDTNEERCAPLVAAGAVRAATIGDLAEAADVLFLSLPGGPEVNSVLFDPDGVEARARAGTMVIDLSTSPVELAQEAAERLGERSVVFVDAPVARTRQAAIDATLSIMVGTPADHVFALVEPYLRTMASDVTHCGATGSGALMKLLNNMVVFETVVALAEAVTVARRSGLVADSLMFDVLGTGSAASFALENHGRKALLPDIHPTGAFSAAYMRKDITYVRAFAEHLGLDLPAASLGQSLLDRVCAGGLSQQYHTAVVRAIEGEV